MRRCVAHADPEDEAAAADLVHPRGRGGEVRSVAGVDVRDRGAESDLVRLERQRQRETQPVTEAGAVDAGETALFDFLSEFQRPLPATRYRCEADGWLLCHVNSPFGALGGRTRVRQPEIYIVA